MTGHPLTPETSLLHATCVAVGPHGVLLLGPPGAGKSDLALRLIDQPGTGISGAIKTAMLVADDQVLVTRQGDALLASAPASLAGRLEIRGLGIVPVACIDRVRLALAVRLAAAATIERLPETESQRFWSCGLSLPEIALDPLVASAPARLRAAVDWLSNH